MAALSELRAPDIVELRHLRCEDLDDLLEEESLQWRSQLSWDFAPSAELVRRWVKIQALNGYALVYGGRAIGYAYYVIEERKALIGDVYVMREFASTAHEDLLLSSVLGSLKRALYVHRIEAQLMMMKGPFERALPFTSHLQIFPRNFMVAQLDDAAGLPAGKAAAAIAVENWVERRQDESAKLIAAAYQNHIDSSINDQYRSVSGASRFLTNIVQYPGCGAFFEPGSFAADLPDGRLAGLCLASLVAADAGHITQICVSPDLRSTGVGYELLRRSLLAMSHHGCTKTSLTVTAENQSAIALYQRMGFRAIRRFAAYVWDGF